VAIAREVYMLAQSCTMVGVDLGLPSLDLRDSLLVEFLEQLGVRPDRTLAGLVNRFVDTKRGRGST
jgi:uncharacterized membrane protein